MRNVQSPIFEPLFPSDYTHSSSNHNHSIPHQQAANYTQLANCNSNHNNNNRHNNNNMIKKKARSQHDLALMNNTITQSKLFLTNENNTNDQDDGSVASKLLSSITKSISSPSLLAYCKESVRETPYQKTLKLKRMKLHHCAEELGSDSGIGFGFDSNNQNSNNDNDMQLFGHQSTPLVSTSDSINQGSSSCISNYSSSIPSTNSLPDLSGLVHSNNKLQTPTLTRTKSFPPPLSHTLPTSSSTSHAYSSFALSLRAYREDGRFVLKEVMVPCRQYFQANRKDGRLTLQLYTRDVEDESWGNFVDHECIEDNSSTTRDSVEVKSNIASQQNLDDGTIEEVKISNRNSTNNEHHISASDDSDSDDYNATSTSIDHQDINETNATSESDIKTSTTINSALQRRNSFQKLQCNLSDGSSLLITTSIDADTDTDTLGGSTGAESNGSNILSATMSASTVTNSVIFESKDSKVIISSSSRSKCHHEATSPLTTSSGGVKQETVMQYVAGNEEMNAKILLEVFCRVIALCGLQGNDKMNNNNSFNSNYGICGSSHWCSTNDHQVPIQAPIIDPISAINAAINALPHDKIKDQLASGIRIDKYNYGSSDHLQLVNINNPNISANNNSSDHQRLHALHCKELFDRSQIAGLMKPNCVATRS